ncbi:Panacea domain-containing protein [Labrys monachus]|uniref:Phage-associated protein n=1 Tax=Labrys monachus TaxID=217067 RepID=A0ABU0FP69_9HYPH|nr:Panacea domain-containing protein [Labrys monachus]MDQ0396336.1 putative phage-associated protein [Labrys monachus]
MQLQKLAYIANGWNTVINGEKLISDTAQAWTFGPVYPNLYEHTKYFGKDPIGRLITPADIDVFRFFAHGSDKDAPAYKADLTQQERDVISHVWRRYGTLDGIKLSELTHQPGTPWFKAYSRGKNSELRDSDIEEHYLKIAEKSVAGQAQEI